MCRLTPSFGKQLKYHVGRCLSMLVLVAISVTSPYLTDGIAWVVRLYQTSRGWRVLACTRVAHCMPLFTICFIIDVPSSCGAIHTPNTLEGVEGSKSSMDTGGLCGCGMVTLCDVSSFFDRSIALPL